MKKIIFILLASVLLFGCKTKEIIHTEYVYQNKIDTINTMKYDSVYFYQKGDTIRIEKFKYITIYKNSIKHDSIIVRDTIQAPVQTKYITRDKQLTFTQKMLISGGKVFFVILILAVVYVFFRYRQILLKIFIKLLSLFK